MLEFKTYRLFSRQKVKDFFQIDKPLFIGILSLVIIGLVILYSASNQNIELISKQAIRMFFAFIIMILFAQIPPSIYKIWAPWIFTIALSFIIAVLIIGVVGKGAQRWLNLWLFQFQPSELMKLAVPLMLAWYLDDKSLPPSFFHLSVLLAIVLIPTLLVVKQPDLGTALLIAISGFSVILLAGISARLLLLGSLLILVIAPIGWHFMHDYQKLRVLTFLNPERDPLGAGYHIIQSKIAIGAGGFFGKGWLQGTQSHLQFLPEHTTDFIFAVCGEEFGLMGSIVLLILYFWITARGFYISMKAQDTFSRLLGGGLSLSFFIAAFVNIGMVSGLLPVVGVPLPLISYGGTSLITLIAGFGILMSIQTHRKLVGN
ncbi:MAG: rod shape-determining protein RodA [Rickettsiella sp.]|nr:rod shape-determining protein RodA [Rickettsiella sp.]